MNGSDARVVASDSVRVVGGWKGGRDVRVYVDLDSLLVILSLIVFNSTIRGASILAFSVCNSEQ